MTIVRYRKHPMTQTVLRGEVLPRETVTDIVARVAPGRTVTVSVGGVTVPRAWWPRLRPKAPVALLGVPTGPAVAALPAILATAAGAAATSAAVTAGVVAAGSIGAALIGAGVALAVGLVGTLAVRALFPPGTQRAPSTTTQQQIRGDQFSIGPARNTLNPGGPVPVLLGTRVRHAPTYMALSSTESDGGDARVNMAFAHSIGPVRLDGFRIGTTPLGRYDGVEHATLTNVTSSKGQSVYARDIAEESLAITLEPNEAQIRRTAPDTVRVSVEISAPSGIFRLNDAAKRIGVRQPIKVAYRRVGDASFTTEIDREINFTIGPYRRSLSFALPSVGQYDIRVTRGPFGFSEAGTARGQTALQWTALRSYQEGRPFQGRTPLTATYLSLIGTGQINGPVDTYSANGWSRCKSWNGSAWVDDVETSNPADLYRFLLQHPANKSAVADSALDLSSIQAFADYCSRKNWLAKGYVTDLTSVDQILRDVCAAGRGSPILINGRHGVVFEDDDAPIVQMFTPANSSGFTMERVYPRPLHGLRCRFVDQDQDFTDQVLEVFADGFDESNATNVEEIDFPFVTREVQIYKFARYAIAETILRPEQYSLTVDWQSLVVQRGDAVLVAHDSISVGLAQGTLAAVSGTTITLDQDVTLEADRTYALRVRGAGGVVGLATVTTGPGTTRQIEVDAVPSAAWRAGDAFALGLVNRETIACKVREIIPGEDLTATLSLVPAAPDITRADNRPIPAFRPRLSPLPDVGEFPPLRLTIDEDLVAAGDGTAHRYRLAWSPPAKGEVERYEIIERTDDDVRVVGEVPGRQTGFDVIDPPIVPAEYEISAAFQGTTVRARTPALRINPEEPSRLPPDPAGLAVAVTGDTVALTVPLEAGLDRLRAERLQVRWSPDVSGATWGRAATVVEAAAGNVVQVPARRGTYFVKWISPFKRESAQAAAAIVSSAGLANANVVETVTEAPAWSGTKTGVVVSTAALQLGTSARMFTGAKMFTGGQMFNEGDQTALSGSYVSPTTVDLSAVYPCRVTTSLSATGVSLTDRMFTGGKMFSGKAMFATVADGWSASIEVRTTNADPAAGEWSEWQPMTVGELAFRAIQWRIAMTSDSTTVSPRVSAASLTVDMPDRDISAGDLSVPADAGGLVVPFDPAFRVLRAVETDIQDAASGDFVEYVARSRSSVTIRVRNSSGALVARTVDVSAKGYGRLTA